MADDANDLQGHDAVWWKGQWDQLKRELDVLNPTLDAVRARVGELEATVGLLTGERDAARQQAKEADGRADQLRPSVEALQVEQKAHRETAADRDRYREVATRRHQGVTAALRAVADLHSVLGSQLAE